MRPAASGGRGSWPAPWWSRFSRPHRHSSGTDHRGVLALDDLAGFEAGYEAAATVEFRGHTIAKTGPWGQGPALLQTLAILSGFEDRFLDPSTELGAHTVLEAQKLALADREAYYGDTDVPLDYLLSEDYCAGRRALITERASHDFRPGTVPGREPYRPPLRTSYTPPALAGHAAAAGLGVGEPTVTSAGETRGDTCHIDVVDRWGNMVSATPSGGWLQSSPAIPELGFCLGTRLQMTWLTRDAVHADARQTPAHHLDAHARAAGRPRRDRAGVARRRPAGPVAAAVPAADHRGRVFAAAGHRRADVPYDVDARAPSGRAPGSPAAPSSRTGSVRTSSRGWNAAGMWSPGLVTGRWGGCPPSCGILRPGSCRLPRIRAVRRATPRAGSGWRCVAVELGMLDS